MIFDDLFLGQLKFPDFPDFKPNKTPKEIMQAGAFGGTYFRVIRSGVTKEVHKDAWKEFPEDWFAGLKVSLKVASPTYRKEINKYNVKCGTSLEEWEGSGNTGVFISGDIISTNFINPLFISHDKNSVVKPVIYHTLATDLVLGTFSKFRF